LRAINVAETITAAIAPNVAKRHQSRVFPRAEGAGSVGASMV
jgi:hypothetical protein